MRKVILLALLTMGFALSVHAQETDKQKTVIELPQWVKDIKISGYGMLQYQFQNPNEKSENTFNLRLMRLIMDGKISDFAWRVQMQGSSNAGPGNPTVMLVDLYAEWQKYEFFKVKAGQFKRAFTFEIPPTPSHKMVFLCQRHQQSVRFWRPFWREGFWWSRYRCADSG